jgi:hypothetical protein
MAHGEGGRVKVTCCQPFGTYCISGGADKQLLVWDLITGSCIKVGYGYGKRLLHHRLLHHGACMAACHKRAEHQAVWQDLASMRLMREGDGEGDGEGEGPH